MPTGKLPTIPLNTSNAIRVVTGPIGLVWDPVNHSCSYDALFTPLINLWKENPPVWTDRLTKTSPWLGLWALAMSQAPNAPETARDSVRQLLNFQDPVSFPTGPRPVALDKLLTAVTDRRVLGQGRSACETCNIQRATTVDTLGQHMDISLPASIRETYPNGLEMSRWFEYHHDRPSARCPGCGERMRRRTTMSELPSLLLLTMNTTEIVLNDTISFNLHEEVMTLRLRGLIYHSAENLHFTSVLVDKEGEMWYHDGMTTRRVCTHLTNIKGVADRRVLHWKDGQRLGAVIYAEDM
ncbi:hypothetical protein DFH06DRAFT_1009914 [Mycena polygramma]|nr:hypothetical protein DFH06DRAFT_1009914 [Mycena polygramma]